MFSKEDVSLQWYSSIIKILLDQFWTLALRVKLSAENPSKITADIDYIQIINGAWQPKLKERNPQVQSTSDSHPLICKTVFIKHDALLSTFGQFFHVKPMDSMHLMHPGKGCRSKLRLNSRDVFRCWLPYIYCTKGSFDTATKIL